MGKRKKHSRTVAFLAAALLCLVCAFFVGDIIRAVQKPFFPRDYRQTVERYAAEYGIDENAVYAIIRTESGFRPEAESAVGARGLMQITEETYEWIKMKIAPAEALTFDDMYDAETNIRFGAYLLSVCLARYDNDMATAAAAYHSGMGLVDSLLQDEAYTGNGKTLKEFPYRQMNRYVYKVQRNYAVYCELYG